MVFTSAAFDNPEMSANAFENVEQGQPNFESIYFSVIVSSNVLQPARQSFDYSS